MGLSCIVRERRADENGHVSFRPAARPDSTVGPAWGRGASMALRMGRDVPHVGVMHSRTAILRRVPVRNTLWSYLAALRQSSAIGMK